MDPRTKNADERVLDVAGRLFAELGYDGTDLELIAAAAGREADGSSLLRKGKERIYHAVLAHYYQRDVVYLQGVLKESRRDVAGLHRLVDAFLDFALAHPEVPSLWGQRALKDALDLSFPEEEFPPPLLMALTSQGWEGVRHDLDLKFLAWVLMWTVRGFVQGGLPDRLGEERYAEHPETLDYFRTRLHELVDRLI